MKKIIAAFDGLRFSNSCCAFAVDIAKHSNTHLVGVFLDDRDRHSYRLYDILKKPDSLDERLKKLDAADEKNRAAAAHNFEVACREAMINYSVHHDSRTAINELLHESIYADLLIVDGKESFSAHKEKTPPRFIRELLAHSQCPVLVTPEKYHVPEKIILLCDGSPSSVLAIKMFSYMLPSLKHLPAELVFVKDLERNQYQPDHKLLREFMKRHFPKAAFKVLRGLAETEIVNYLKVQNLRPLVVLGAYNRGAVSRWFKSSMADTLLNNIKAPLFVAHSR